MPDTTTAPMVATKTCKQCEVALPLDAFNTKQARCKPCFQLLRSGLLTR